MGGGPAGLYAAQLLAAVGLSVCVLEEHAEIGSPVHCTGILGAEAFDLPGLPTDVVLARPAVARFYSPVGCGFEYAAGDEDVCVIDRGAFDARLADTARRAGATILTRTRVVAIDTTRSDGIVAHAVNDGRSCAFVARVCVLACGASYAIQRALGWGLPPLFLGSAQTELGGGAAEGVSVFLRSEVAPTGFGWLVPIRRGGERRAKVGVMGPSGARRVLARLLHDLRPSGRVSGSAGPVVSRLLPLGPLRRTYSDRLLAIGDAAGLVKPTTGGGIYYSLLSARWAADTLRTAFERGDFSRAVLADYEAAWRAQLGRELRVGIWFRRLARWFTPADLDDLAKLAITDGVMPEIRAAARFNWHHELILRVIRHPGVLQIVLRRVLDVVAERGWEELDALPYLVPGRR